MSSGQESSNKEDGGDDGGYNGSDAEEAVDDGGIVGEGESGV